MHDRKRQLAVGSAQAVAAFIGGGSGAAEQFGGVVQRLFKGGERAGRVCRVLQWIGVGRLYVFGVPNA